MIFSPYTLASSWDWFFIIFFNRETGKTINLSCGKAWRNRVLVTNVFKIFSWLYHFVISHASSATSSAVIFWRQRKASKLPHPLMAPLGWRWKCETVVEPEAWWPPSRSREASSSDVFDPWRSKTGRCSVRWPGAGYHWNLGRWGGIRAAHWAHPSPQDYPPGCGCAPWLRNPPPTPTSPPAVASSLSPENMPSLGRYRYKWWALSKRFMSMIIHLHLCKTRIFKTGGHIQGHWLLSSIARRVLGSLNLIHEPKGSQRWFQGI